MKEDAVLNTLEVANLYYEDSRTIWAHPNSIADIRVEQIDDPYFDEQWFLNNTPDNLGTPDVDIDALEAWDITIGIQDIVVAVIDQGVEAHEDLPASRLVPGFDPSGLGNGEPTDDDHKHGQCVAGIIAASHNTLGVRGVAGNVKIMPINIFSTGTGDQEIADAIDWAWQNGADILSNSWGYWGQNTWYDNIAEAITRALTQGRNGRGAMVVKSAGNNGEYVTFPGTVPGVLVSGAMDKDDNKWDYSPPDPEVDVVAPSGDLWYGGCDFRGDIWTVDRHPGGYTPCSGQYFGDPEGKYFSKFGGTSAAAPQVSAIGALLLSLDPDLEARSVGDNPNPELQNIIKETAIDYGSTNWDGYGRVNAYDALKYTLENYGGTISGDATISGEWTFHESITINDGATLTIEPGSNLNFTDDVQLKIDGKLIVQGTESNRVILTSDNPEYTWRGIFMEAVYNGGQEVNMSYCTIANSDYGIEMTDGDAIRNVLLDHVVFSNCECDGVFYFWNFGEGNQIDMDVSVTNCTFYHSDFVLDMDLGLGYPPDLSNYHIILKNNIFSNSTVAAALGDWTNNLDESYNDYFNCDILHFGISNTSITEDPLFNNPGNGIYTLQSDSPCINAGDPDSPLDPDGTIADMGAYYYDAIPSAPVLSISGSWGDHPTLSWVDGGEPDIDHFVLKKTYINDSGKMTWYINISAGINEYTDNHIVIQKFGNTIAKYWVKTVDWINQESPYSNMKSTSGLGPLWRQVTEIENLPLEFALHENHPNPFNPITTIKYDLPEESFVELRIFDLLGREIRTLISRSEQAGYKSIIWNGENNMSNTVSSGIYIYTLIAKSLESDKDFHKTRKMLLMR